MRPKNPSSPVRIAHLIYSQAVGGSEIVAVNICAHLDRNKYEPIILFLYDRPGPLEDILTQHGIPSYRLKMSRQRRLFRPFVLAYIFNKLKVDILHVHHLNFYQQVISGARLSRVKGLVYTEHSFRGVAENMNRQVALQRAVRTVDCCTVITQDMRHQFVHNFNVDPSKVKVVYNGVDCKRFSPEEEKPDPLNLPGNFTSTVLLSVARFVKEKDHETLLAAMKILDDKGYDVLLVLVGSGALQREIEKKIIQLDLKKKIIMAGAQTNIADYLYHSDIFVLSSKSEGLPMVILEAMASGIPVVSTDVGGIAEIVSNEQTGMLVPPQEPKKLAAAIEKIVLNPGLAKKLSTQARKLMLSRFDQKIITESYCNIYSDILQ